MVEQAIHSALMRIRRWVVALVVVAAVAAVAGRFWYGPQRPVPVAPARILPNQAPAVRVLPEKKPTASRPATATPTPKVSISPSPPVAPPAVVATAAPEAAPRIISASLSRSVAAPGETVSGTVITSSNVASVEARIVGYGQALTKTGVGVFTLTYRVPNVPVLFRRTYSIQVIARNASGVVTAVSLPITIR